MTSENLNSVSEPDRVPWYVGKMRHVLRFGFAMVLLICFVSQWCAFSAESDVFRSRIQIDTYERGILLSRLSAPLSRPAHMEFVARNEFPQLERRFGTNATGNRIFGMEVWNYEPGSSPAAIREQGILIPYVHLLTAFGVGIIIQAVWTTERAKRRSLAKNNEGSHDNEDRVSPS